MCELCASCRKRVRLGRANGAHTLANARTHKKPRCLGFSPSVNRALGGSLSHCLSISGQTPLRLCFSFSLGLDLPSCLWLPSARQFAGALDDFIYPFFQVPSQQEPPRFASLQVAINHAVWSWNGAGAGGQTDRQWAAAVSGLDGLRQPTREPHADDAPSPPCNAEGLIRVLSITFQAKLILTFKPGWSPCTLSRPSEYFATGVGYKKQQYESTNKDKTDLQLKEHFVMFKRFFQLEIEWKMSV